MTNREKYISKRDEYDLMMTISKTGCPIWVVTGEQPKRWNHCLEDERTCGKCIQHWLNEDAEEQTKADMDIPFPDSFLMRRFLETN